MEPRPSFWYAQPSCACASHPASLRVRGAEGVEGGAWLVVLTMNITFGCNRAWGCC